jgi:hypothetical protein
VPKRCERERVSGAVGEIEPALQEFALLSASFNLARPDFTSPANSLASGGSFVRTFPGPARRSSGDGEVMFGSDHPDLRLLQHPRDERILTATALRKLRHRIDRRIDVSADALGHPL